MDGQTVIHRSSQSIKALRGVAVNHKATTLSHPSSSSSSSSRLYGQSIPCYYSSPRSPHCCGLCGNRKDGDSFHENFLIHRKTSFHRSTNRRSISSAIRHPSPTDLYRGWFLTPGYCTLEYFRCLAELRHDEHMELLAGLRNRLLFHIRHFLYLLVVCECRKLFVPRLSLSRSDLHSRVADQLLTYFDGRSLLSERGGGEWERRRTGRSESCGSAKKCSFCSFFVSPFDDIISIDLRGLI